MHIQDGPRVVATPELGSIYLNVQPHALTISDNLRATYTFDREGRLLGCFVDGVNYRCGLCGDILLKATQPGGGKLRRILPPDERASLAEGVHAAVARIGAAIAGQVADELRAWLAVILAWDAGRRERDRQAFQAIYKPVSIVPPDQYRAVVLQATEGCSWNRCSFCTFYRDHRFHIKGPAELREHIRQIKAFLGRGLALRTSVFLGDANALIIPQPRLLDLLQVVYDELPPEGDRAPRGIYAFLDIFGGEQKTTAQYADLRAAGVRRVYIGLESGDPEVFRLLNKPGSPEACVEVVRRIKAGGIDVGVILLAGPGGATLAGQHVAQSIAALEAMGLGAGDLVYISPLIVPDDGPYSQQARDLGLAPLGAAELEAQLAALKLGAAAATQRRPKVALYHIEEWIY
ncbi:MAG: radical SAM protein [Chloroflexales bacterium]|nr:radical SAM protein [Chloroflexales bacterium]